MARDINELIKLLRELIEEGISTGVPTETLAEAIDPMKIYGKGWAELYSKGEQIWFMPADFGGWRVRRAADGGQYFEVIINGAHYYLIVGELRSYPAAVFHFYQNAVASHMEDEEYKRKGPSSAPWSKGNSLGNTWYHEPEAPVFEMDLDGRYIGRLERWFDALPPGHNFYDEHTPRPLPQPKEEPMTKQFEKGPMPGRKSKKVKLPTNTGADIMGPAKKEGKLKKKVVPGSAGLKAEKGKFNKSNLM